MPDMRSSPGPNRQPIGPRWSRVGLLLALLAIAACSSGGDEGPSDGPVTAEQVLVDAAAAMVEVETAAFTLEQTGAEVAIDAEGQLRFLEARGRIARPASADAVVTVDALGFTTEVGAIAIDGTVWFTNPLTGDWIEAPEAFTFDPAALFDPDDGLAGLLAEAAPTAELVEADEPVATGDGELPSGPEGAGPWHRVRATVSAERVETLTGGLVAEATVVDAWIDQATDRLAELRFEIPIGATVSDWRLALTDYDIEVEINPPEQVEAGS
jgi:hypothetical protein